LLEADKSTLMPLAKEGEAEKAKTASSEKSNPKRNLVITVPYKSWVRQNMGWERATPI